MLRIKPHTVRKRRNIEASRLFDVPWLLAPAALRSLVLSHQAAVARSEQDVYDDEEQEEADYPIVDGVACLTISGVLTKSRYWSTTSYGDIGASISHALANAAVGGILLSIHSPGGETADLFDLADAIYSARQIKPIVACASDDCYSAAYCLASSAEKLFVTRTGGAGSIGCWTAHTSYAGMLQKQGVEIEYVYSGARKIDGNPTMPLSVLAKASLQAEVDRIRGLFVQTVSRNRNVSKTALMNTEGACFMSGDGVPLLCDQVGTVADAAAYLRGRIQSVAPRSQRVITSARSLPAAQQPMTLIQDRDDIAGLCASAFGGGGTGCAEISLSRAESIARFGKPGAILAIRSFAQSRSSAPVSGRQISMLVAPYDNSLCNLGGGLFERYEKNCFSQGLNGDPAILVNHNEEKILGLKSAGTARFWESSDGLHAEANDVPNTTFGSDALESVRRLECKRASAAFWIISARMEHRGSDRIRVVERAVLRDASVLEFAAYLNTSSQLLQLPAAASALSSGPFAVQKAKLALLGLR